MKKLVPLAALLVASTLSGASFGQQAKGFALDTFEPSERGSDWFAAESLDLRGYMRPAAGVVVDWAHEPLVLANPDGSIKTQLVSDQVVVHPGASLVMFDRVRVAFDMPLAVFQDGNTLTLAGQQLTAPSSFALGDLRLGVDARLYGKYGDPFTLAFGAQVFVPTGSQSSFTSDGTVRLQPRLMAAGTIDQFTYAVKAGFEWRPESGDFGQSPLGSSVVFNAAGGIRVANEKLLLGPEIFGSTIVTSSAGAFQKANTPVEALFSAHLLAGPVRIGLGAGGGLTHGYGSPDYRVLGTIEWAPPYVKRDRDGDGIPDDDDACPDVPGIRSDDPKKNGCPPDRDEDGVPDVDDACPDVKGIHTTNPKTNGCPSDKDADGIPDTEDACPTVPGVKTDDPKTNGCPPDRDHDGVPDAEDACPDVPGIHTNDPKTNGCPGDRDKDGIADNEDACPDAPGPRSSDPKTNGCPPDPDRDKDGIPNAVDACPDAPGKPDPDPKKNGCPLAFVQGTVIHITDQVKFRFDSAELDPTGEPVLFAVAKILMEHPEITLLRVEGHTDHVGGPGYNQKLSVDRAAAVVTWLVGHGIDAARLVSQGFGMTRPLISNADENGRRLNRRVEFHIVTRDTKAPPAPKTPGH
jgi:outer membrane protein OmpA-like peptidoglycan-associated protein